MAWQRQVSILCRVAVSNFLGENFHSGSWGRGTLPKAPHEKTGLRYFNNLNIMFVCMHKLQFGHIMILCNQFNICFHSPFSKQRNCIFSLVSLRPHTAVTFSMVHSPLPPPPHTHQPITPPASLPVIHVFECTGT